MTFSKIGNHNNPTEREEIKAILKDFYAMRRSAGMPPRGDVQLLEPEFIDFTEDGVSIVKMYVKDWQRNGLDNLQGGMLSCMMDCTYGVLGYVTAGFKPIGTVDMTSNYIRTAGPEDTELFFHTKILNAGKTIIHASCHVFNAHNKIVATSTTNIMVLKPRKGEHKE